MFTLNSFDVTRRSFPDNRLVSGNDHHSRDRPSFDRSQTEVNFSWENCWTTTSRSHVLRQLFFIEQTNCRNGFGRIGRSHFPVQRKQLLRLEQSTGVWESSESIILVSHRTKITGFHRCHSHIRPHRKSIQVDPEAVGGVDAAENFGHLEQWETRTAAQYVLRQVPLSSELWIYVEYFSCFSVHIPENNKVVESDTNDGQ